jgi:hypothetical protein
MYRNAEPKKKSKSKCEHGLKPTSQPHGAAEQSDSDSPERSESDAGSVRDCFTENGFCLPRVRISALAPSLVSVLVQGESRGVL